VVVERLKAEPGKDIWLFGGGTLFRSLLELRLVDSVAVALIPVLLGGGTPFLPGLAEIARLRLAGQRVYATTGTVALTYELA
jgi:dihydrofolate reductase